LKKLKSIKRSAIKERVMRIRREMPRLGTRKLYYLLQENFLRDGLSIGRDRLFNLLREEGLLIVKKEKIHKNY
jgi:putative transposase